MSKKRTKAYFSASGTIIPFENVSHTVNEKAGEIKVKFIYNVSFIHLLDRDIAERFIDEYTEYLNNLNRLHL